ncbi:MAG: glyoxalase [Rhodospirillales bacterium]|jgi:uncharacterized glyoxalase superfamily protein PhnB|nr:glyoxalase [Rhodospirillales bacterium]
MLIPGLQYRDAPAAIEFLSRAFGLTRGMIVPGPDGTIAHAQLWHDGACLMLGTRRNDHCGQLDPMTTGGVTHTVYMVVAEIDAHHARAVAAGASVEVALRDTDYGSRDYSARDPEGHLWHFGTYRPDPTETAP